MNSGHKKSAGLMNDRTTLGTFAGSCVPAPRIPGTPYTIKFAVAGM
ncbi:MAG: hypothetical protein IBX68_07705 [Dehalococcoidia bacterium]|nr:hypothetical protein [Dehalococcoidia bacterium]